MQFGRMSAPMSTYDGVAHASTPSFSHVRIVQYTPGQVRAFLHR